MSLELTGISMNHRTNLSNYPEGLIRGMFVFIITILFISPLLPTLVIISNIPLGIQEFFYLIIFSFSIWGINNILRTTEYEFRYTALSLTLIVLIILTGLPQVSIRTVLSHIAAVAIMLAMAFILRNIDEISLLYLVYSAYLAGIVIALWDISIFLSPASLPGSTATILPFIQKGGIASSKSMGTHGIIVGMGVIAGLYFLSQQNEIFSSKVGLMRSGIVLMVFSVFLSGSRSSILALILGTSFFYKYKLRQFSHRIIAIYFTSFIIFFTSSVYYLAIQRTKTVFQRFEQSRKAVELTLSNPISGVGWEYIFPNELSHVIHNTPLNYFAASGVFTGIFYILILLYPLIISARSAIQTSDHRRLTSVFVSIYILISVELMLYKSTPNFYLFIFGITICIAVTKKTQDIY